MTTSGIWLAGVAALCLPGEPQLSNEGGLGASRAAWVSSRAGGPSVFPCVFDRCGSGVGPAGIGLAALDAERFLATTGAEAELARAA